MRPLSLSPAISPHPLCFVLVATHSILTLHDEWRKHLVCGCVCVRASSSAPLHVTLFIFPRRCMCVRARCKLRKSCIVIIKRNRKSEIYVDCIKIPAHINRLDEFLFAQKLKTRKAWCTRLVAANSGACITRRRQTWKTVNIYCTKHMVSCQSLCWFCWFCWLALVLLFQHCHRHANTHFIHTFMHRSLYIALAPNKVSSTTKIQICIRISIARCTVFVYMRNVYFATSQINSDKERTSYKINKSYFYQLLE